MTTEKTEWKVEVHHINVNQGDSTLILVYETVTDIKSGKKIKDNELVRSVLIDAGENAQGTTKVLPYLKEKLKGKKVPKLDAIVITHDDKDHVGGFTELLGNFEFTDMLKGTYLYDQGNSCGTGANGARYYPYIRDVDINLENFTELESDLENAYSEAIIKKRDKTLEGKIIRLTSSIRNNGEESAGDSLLGYELLWGTKETYEPYSENPLEEADLIELRERMEKEDEKKPALFCIAVNEKTLEPTTNVALVPEIVPDEVTIQNRRSIVLILVSPQNQILHYLGGDIGPENSDSDTDPEIKIANWAKAQGYKEEEDDTFVPIMKLSHHGSQRSTPPELVQSFRPKYPIISAKGAKHLHPDFGTIFYFKLFNDLLRSKKRLAVPLSTNCPDWAYAKGKTGKVLNTFQGNRNSFEAQFNFDKKIETEVDHRFQAILDEMDPKIGKKKVYEVFKGIWDSFCHPRTGNDERFRGNKGEGAVRAIQIDFDIDENGEVNIDTIFPAYDYYPSSVSKKRVFSKSPPIQKQKKSKSKKTSVPMALLTNPISIIIASSDSSQGDIFLVKGCEIDEFVSSLTNKQLVLTNVEKKIEKDNWQISGALTSDLAQWFNEFDINKITVNLSGIQKNNQLDIKRTDVHFSAEIAPEKLSASKPVVFDGSLQPDNTLCFTLSTKDVTTDLFMNAQFVGYWNKNNKTILAQNFLTLLRSQTTLLDNNTQIVFNPPYLSTISLDFVSQVNDFTLFNKLIKLKKVKIAFTSNNYPISDDWISCMSGCYLEADFDLGNAEKPDFSANLEATLYSNGSGVFAFSPTAEGSNPDQILQKVCQTLLGQTATLPALNDIKLTCNLIKSVVIHFDLNKDSITSFEIISQANLNDLSAGKMKKNITFETHLFLPDPYIWGDLIIERNLSDNSDEDVVMSGVAFTDFLGNYAIALPPTTSKDVEKFELANFYFTASLSTQTYTLNADVFLGKESIWSVTIADQEIQLEEINLSLQKNPKHIDAKLEGRLKLGNAKATVTAAYSTASQPPRWIFGSYISYINLSDIVSLFSPLKDTTEAPALPPFLLSNIDLALNVTDKNFNFTGNLSIGPATFTVTADSTKAEKTIEAHWDGKEGALNLSDLIREAQIDLPFPDIELNIESAGFIYRVNDKTLIFDLTISGITAKLYIFPYNNGTTLTYSTLFNLVCPFTHLPSIPVVGEINSPIKNLQLLLASQDVKGNDIKTLNLSWPENVTEISKGASLFVTLDEKISTTPLLLSLPAKSLAANQPARRLRGALAESTPSGQWLNVQKSFGPLNINRIGINYHDKKLWILFDAALMMSGLSIQLQGLSIGVALERLDLPEINLSGLGLDYHAGLVEIGGSFLKETTALTPNEEIRYGGTAVLKTEALSLAAMGIYSKLKNGDVSLFLFGHSTASLGGPPYFYIKGFMGGFGYHQKIRLPSQNEVVHFPLVQGIDDASVIGGKNANIMTVLQSLESGEHPWFVPMVGENWFAAGIDFTTFELINGKALLVAEFGQDFQVGLLGRATITVPKTGHPLAYAEMGLSAVFKPAAGFFGMNAVLSPDSYVLDPACHLTGGFAFYNWFNTGDFVVTFGGYHPSFNKPPLYPDEPRLGFNWLIDDHVSIKGEAYFALTPSCVMGGGALDAVYHAGDLRAWFTAYANFLMQWQPFHYGITAGIDLGASYHLDLGFVSKTFKVELGADLELQGPPLGGTAHIHWWVISFTISFGPTPQTPTIGWDEFKHLLPKKSLPSASPHLLAAAEPVSELCKIVIEKGLIREEIIEGKTYWTVRADEFCFHIESAIPLTQITLNGETVEEKDNKISSAQTLNIKPMGKKELTSINQITIQNMDDPTYKPAWIKSIITRNVPEALWGELESTPDGNPAAPSAKTLPNRWAGLFVAAPSSTVGNTPGPIPLKQAFGYVPVKEGILPYGEKAAATTVTAGNIENIQKTIANNPQRNNTVATLAKIGIFASTAKLSELNRFTKQAGNLFSASPLEMK